MLIWTITFACKAFIFIKFTEIWRVLLENSSVLLCFREEWENIFPSEERRDGYFHSWVYSAAETSLNITSLPDLSGKLCVNVGCFLFLLFAHSLSRVSLCVGDCRDRPHTNESELDTTWPQTLTFRWPWGQDGLGGASERIPSFITDGKTAIFPSVISFQAVDRKEQAPKWALVHFSF